MEMAIEAGMDMTEAVMREEAGTPSWRRREGRVQFWQARTKSGRWVRERGLTLMYPMRTDPEMVENPEVMAR